MQGAVRRLSHGKPEGNRDGSMAVRLPRTSRLRGVSVATAAGDDYAREREQTDRRQE